MSRDQLATAIVVPCYNESARLRPDEFLDFHHGHPLVHFLMVDDGSEDGTWTMLGEMRAKAPERIATLRLERNRGKAEAVRRGVSKALKAVSPHGTPVDLVGYWPGRFPTPGSSTWKSCRAFGPSGVRKPRTASWNCHSRSGRMWLDPRSGSGTVGGRR